MPRWQFNPKLAHLQMHSTAVFGSIAPSGQKRSTDMGRTVSRAHGEALDEQVEAKEQRGLVAVCWSQEGTRGNTNGMEAGS